MRKSLKNIALCLVVAFTLISTVSFAAQGGSIGQGNIAVLKDDQIVDTLKQTASQSGGKLKEELGYLSDHLKHSGTRTGEQVRDALQKLVAEEGGNFSLAPWDWRYYAERCCSKRSCMSR